MWFLTYKCCNFTYKLQPTYRTCNMLQPSCKGVASIYIQAHASPLNEKQPPSRAKCCNRLRGTSKGREGCWYL